MKARFGSLGAIVFSLGVAGCTTHAPAALAVDTPLLPYQAPDLAELTGEDGLDELDDAEDAGSPATTPTPAAPEKAGK